MISNRLVSIAFASLLALGCNGDISTVPSEQEPALPSGKDKTTEQKPTEPVACPPVIPNCAPGEIVADLNGDGCALECAACPAILCAKGTRQVDTNGDGCLDACEPVSCPPVVPNCKEGEKAADVDGDGCALECVACGLIPCAFGLTPFDTDGDGCPDTCK